MSFKGVTLVNDELSNVVTFRCLLLLMIFIEHGFDCRRSEMFDDDLEMKTGDEIGVDCGRLINASKCC